MESKLFDRTYYELKELFNDILSISWNDIKEKQPTFIEISGYPNHENVVSNIYQFFLEERFHGFGRLFLSALDDCVEGKDISMNEFRVHREAITDQGGRVDLVIEEINFDENVSKAVIIENKIYHTLENDLNDYFDTFSGVNDRTLILLTLDEHPVDPPFINITHQQWIEKIQQRIGNHFISTNPKYLVLLQDFINHMHNFYEKRIDMDALKYLFENGEKINQIKSLEQEGISYISEEIGKVLTQTNWDWGRLIQSGVQVQRKDKPLIGYFNYQKIFLDKKISFQLWLKGEKYVNIRKERRVSEHIKSIAKKNEIKLKESQDSKEWFNIAEKVYQINDINQMENIGERVLDFITNDWEEFTKGIETEYTE